MSRNEFPGEHFHPHEVPCPVLSSRNTSCWSSCGHPLPHEGGGEFWDDDGDDVPEPSPADSSAQTTPAPREVVLRDDPTKVLGYACPACGMFYTTSIYLTTAERALQAAHSAASACCHPICQDCQAPLQDKKSHRLRCPACDSQHDATRRAELLAKAERICEADYTGPVFVDRYDKYFSDVSELRDRLADESLDEELPTVWACTISKLHLDAGDILTNALEDHHEDAGEWLERGSERALQDVIDAWAAQYATGVVTWNVDNSRVVVLDPSPPAVTKVARTQSAAPNHSPWVRFSQIISEHVRNMEKLIAANPKGDPTTANAIRLTLSALQVATFKLSGELSEKELKARFLSTATLKEQTFGAQSTAPAQPPRSREALSSPNPAPEPPSDPWLLASDQWLRFAQLMADEVLNMELMIAASLTGDPTTANAMRLTFTALNIAALAMSRELHEQSIKNRGLLSSASSKEPASK